MSHTKLAIAITAITAMILLWQTSLVDDFVLFILAGVIPGTKHSLSPTTMLTLAWTGLILLAFSSEQVRASTRRLIGLTHTSLVTLYEMHKHRLKHF